MANFIKSKHKTNPPINIDRVCWINPIEISGSIYIAFHFSESTQAHWRYSSVSDRDNEFDDIVEGKSMGYFRSK